jgi:hypothetical protein
MPMTTFPAVAALLVPLFGPVPDVLPPGHRSLTHELVLEASPLFEVFELYAWPVAGFSGETHIVPGQAFQFSSKYGTRIFAFDKGAKFPAAAIAWIDHDPSAADLTEHGVRAVGAIPVQEQDSAPIGSPVERVLTHLRVAAVADGEVRLEVVGEDVERDQSTLLALGGALSAGVVGLGLLLRARRRAGAPESRPFSAMRE